MLNLLEMLKEKIQKKKNKQKQKQIWKEEKVAERK